MKNLLLSILILALTFSCKEKNEKVINTSEVNGQLFYNGKIITMNSEEAEYVEAIVEQDGKIVFVGSKKDAEENFANAKRINLNGNTMLPGFIDPHSHFGMVSSSMGQVDLNSQPVGDITSIEDMMQKMKNYKSENNISEGEWIFGWGYDESQIKEKRHPNKNEIDAVLPNNPVYLQHTSGHMGVGNSMALDMMNVTADSKDPEGGTIERFPDSKEPTGLVQETAMYPFVGNMMKILEKKQGEFFDITQVYYASNGITTAHDGMTDRIKIQFFQTQADAGKFKIDLLALGGYTELETNLKDSLINWKIYKNRFKVQGTKIIADGSPQGKTAYFTEAFLTPVPGCESNCKGLPSISQKSMNDLFVMAYKDDNQLFIHGNGDGSIDMILEAHKYACEKLNQPLDKDRRTVVIHSQFVRADQMDTYVKYNILPSFFTNHAYFWGDVHVENLGEERAFALSPIASASKLGLKFTNHSDATVTPIDPLFTVWSAVNRISRTGRIIGPKEKATPYQALKAITSHAAFEYFEENSKGSLSKGKLADFVILDKDPLSVDPMEIKDIKVVETIKEGKSIFKK
jgi:hypothetical protein